MFSLRNLFDGHMYLSGSLLYEKGKRYLVSDQIADWTKAAKCFLGAANRGRSEAQYQLGLCYFEGKGVPRNRVQALYRLTAAADAGIAEAMAKLSFLYLEGLPDFDDAPHVARLIKDERHGRNNVDTDKALYWANKAIEGGATEGHVCLGYIYSLEGSVYKDIGLAIEHYRVAMVAGSRKAGLGLGQTLLRFRSADLPALKEAEKALLFAMEEKSPVAAYLLGGLYEVGSGVEKDLSRSRELYRLAAEGGVIKAMVRLSTLLLDGHGGPQNQTDGETWLRRAALKGDWAACRLLGEMYASRHHAYEMRRWYEIGAGHGDPVSTFRLGGSIERLQESGRMSIDAAECYLRALQHGYEPAARKLAALAAGRSNPVEFENRIMAQVNALSVQGNPLAHLVLASCIRSSKNGDMVVARELLIKASQAGIVAAHFAAGQMIMKGLGGKADAERAREFFYKAAEAGHISAMYALGLLYQKRGGIGSNMAQAALWYRRAASGGHKRAQRMLETLPFTGTLPRYGLQKAVQMMPDQKFPGGVSPFRYLRSTPESTRI
ncbi:sel1 repeat family protein [Gluconacetobacter johannae]|uniref:Sel1 repeat family protein n=1 Tax=Gluconacetobacter johannae TaxID=112140 RepID=A0A7W4J9N7_9PROT|nr:sel1 repeat family protein [Gluconacetobacter johannae]